VQHHNIVPLLGWSQDAPAPCLVYALMEGGSLQDRLACAHGELPLSVSERLAVLHDVAVGLAYLHSELHVIHCDVKSANVLLDRGLVGRIGDFGIARAAAASSSGGTKTVFRTENIVGTSVYMAPEYLRSGDLSRKVCLAEPGPAPTRACLVVACVRRLAYVAAPMAIQLTVVLWPGRYLRLRGSSAGSPHGLQGAGAHASSRQPS